MADFLYKTTIFTDTSSQIGLNTSLENSNKSDFETNYKSQAFSITDIELSGQTSIIELSYDDFKLKIVNPIFWSNVKYITRSDRYNIFVFEPSTTDITDTTVVDVNLLGGNVTISSIVNDANIFYTDIITITSKNDFTIRSYTVPSGKTFRLVTWQVNADHPLALDLLLQVNGTSVIKFYLDPSQGKSNEYIYTAPVKIANAGDIITIVGSPSAPRGEINSVLVGIES